MSRKTHPREADTATRIITVAEAIFAERGYRGVSLREVMRESGVNSAAIHYHFGSKEALLEAIFIRRAGALNEAREQLLMRCLRRNAENDATQESRLTDILRAFLVPAFALPDDHSGGRRFSRLRSVLAHENAELSQRLIAKYFNDTSRHFIAALREVLPEIPESALYWRFHFLLGAQYYTLSHPGRMESLAGASFDRSNLQMALDEMVAFVASGFSAPLARHEARPLDMMDLPEIGDPVTAVKKNMSLTLPRRALAASAAGASDEAPPQPDAGDEPLPDALWPLIEPLLPPPPERRKRQPGRIRITDREALDGILYLLRRGLRWRDLDQTSSQRSGASCWRRLQEWKASGCWPELVTILRATLPDGEALDFERIT